MEEREIHTEDVRELTQENLDRAKQIAKQAVEIQQEKLLELQRKKAKEAREKEFVTTPEQKLPSLSNVQMTKQVVGIEFEICRWREKRRTNRLVVWLDNKEKSNHYTLEQLTSSGIWEAEKIGPKHNQFRFCEILLSLAGELPKCGQSE